MQEGLWITYLAGIKGGFILIPAAGILSANDLVYRFRKARPNVIITDRENLSKMEQALSEYEGEVGVKLLLDGGHTGCSSFDLIESESPDAVAASVSIE